MKTEDFLPDDPDASPEQIAAWKDAIEQNPELRSRLAAWAEMRGDVRRELRFWLDDRQKLVDAALGDSDAETIRRLETDSREHPGLADVARSIRLAASDFSDAWDEQILRDRTPMGSQRPPVRSGPSPLRWIWRSAVAASVVIFIGLAVTLSGREPNMITVSTQPGEVVFVELAGGSTVQVLESSIFMYPDPARVPVTRGNTRLEGAAYFQIVPGGAGLVVETPEAITTVLGTEFGVRSADGASEVFVARGAVSVASVATGLQVRVSAAEMTVVERGADPSAPITVAQADIISWQNLMVFRSAPMERVARVLAQRYGVAIELDPGVAEATVTGTFEAGADVREVLETIAAALGGEIWQTADGHFVIRAES
jgi:transmembrane sensor